MLRPGQRTSLLLAFLLFAVPLATAGCGAFFVGAAATGGGYETYQNAEMQKLEEEYAAGKIDQAEYEARKKQIQKSSLLQQ